MFRPKIRWRRPWWMSRKAGMIVLPPFGIWIDPRYEGTGYGEMLAVHARVHWHQFGDRPLSYYVRWAWHRMLNTPPIQNPLELEAVRASDVIP